MKPAQPHKREEERLKELYKYEILDTLEEEDFDILTRLAGQIAQTPISLISLIDSDRQWFKSKQGLEESETPRDISFCGHAINDDGEIFEIPNAREDERFSDNPMVTSGSRVAFYAGVTLETSKGLPLGTLCVVDSKPKKLTNEQINALRDLARQVMNTLELRRKTKQLNQTLKIIEDQNIKLQEFASNAAHDLKSPLANIQSLSNILDSELDQNNVDEAKSINAYIRESADSLLKLTEEMLDNIKENKSNQSIENFTSSEEIEMMVEKLYRITENLDIRLDLGVKVLPVPPTTVKRWLINFISNSIKHNDKDQTIVSIRSEWKGNRMVITFGDNGPGIPESKRESVFDLFETLSGTDRYGRKSHGIGLNFIKESLHDHQGEIKIGNSELGGAEFVLSFPQQESSSRVNELLPQ